MNKKHWSLIVVAALLASCQKSADAPVTAAPEADAPAAAVQTAVGGAQQRKPILPGIYRVCVDDGAAPHGTVDGSHLAEGDMVHIKPIKDPATKVCLKKKCREPSEAYDPNAKVIWMAGDENLLAGSAPFEHMSDGGAVQVVHFVKIFDDPQDPGEPPGKCKRDTMLKMEFCSENEQSGELNCLAPQSHLGHVHIDR